MSTWGLFR